MKGKQKRERDEGKTEKGEAENNATIWTRRVTGKGGRRILSVFFFP